MRENKYDNKEFFEQYSQMERSVKGLEGAGEWHVLKQMLPDFTDKRVLDLGCGFGWHCRYAINHRAKSVVGVDISQNMLDVARKYSGYPTIQYIRAAIEDVEFPPDCFDVVISSLAFHYVDSFSGIVHKIYHWLSEKGEFVFSVEHPVFTAYGTQDWYKDSEGKHLHWAVDNYFSEGIRKTNFLGEDVQKYHKTLSGYLQTLIKAGFEITGVAEPEPDKKLLEAMPEMKDELRRPMFLIVSARKSI